MIDYARDLKLALQDTLRRTSIKAAAGVLIGIGFGFLLAALWSFLANELDWGSMFASLTIGLIFVVIGAVLITVIGRARHRIPGTDELQREVETRVGMVINSAASQARHETARFVDSASDHIHAAIGRPVRRARDTADAVRDTATEFADDLGAAKDAAMESARGLAQKAKRTADSDTGSTAKLMGAFAVGITLASMLMQRKNKDDD